MRPCAWPCFHWTIIKAAAGQCNTNDGMKHIKWGRMKTVSSAANFTWTINVRLITTASTPITHSLALWLSLTCTCAHLMYTKWWKCLSVCASTCMPLKQCIWRLGHGNSSVLPGSLHPGWTIVSLHTPLSPIHTHPLLCSSSAILPYPFSPHTHQESKPSLCSGRNLPVWVGRGFVIGGCLGSSGTCLSPSWSVHQTTRMWQRGAKIRTAWGFQG